MKAVTQARVHECIDRLACLDGEPVIALIIDGAQIVCFRKKKLTAERELPIEEIGFRQVEDKVLSLRAVLNAQPELLTRTRKGWPVQQIEVALREFNKTDQAVDRAKTSAEAKRTGPFLLHQNRQIFTAGYVRIFRISFDFRKITQILKTFLGRVHANSVEDISRRDKHFATNHLVLGACVTDNIDSLQERAVPLLDFIMHVDPSRTGRRAFRQNHKIDITAAAVGIRKRLRIVVQRLRRIDAPFLHLQQCANFFFRRYFLSRNCQLTDVILRTLRNHDRENQRTIVAAFPAHVFNFHIDIPMVLVPFADFVQILLQLHFVQSAGFIEKGNECLATRFHLFAQDPLAKMLVPLELDPAHRPFRSFVDRENHTRSPPLLVNCIDPKLSADVSETMCLINFDDFLARFLQLLLVYRLVKLQFDFFA